MKHWVVGVRSICMTVGCIVALTGCVFRGTHYKSLSELRAATSLNYSQQVLDTIIGACEEARLPAFFKVENALSAWSPSITGSAAAAIPMLVVGNTNVTGTLGGTETFNNQIQYNNFSPSSMTRVAALYSLVCFELRYGNTVLPNGTFYTVMDKANSPEHFVIWTKTRNGQYVGVTPAKVKAFLQFAYDVTYWTQHAEPHPQDLLSTPGKLYRFSVEYNTTAGTVVEARLAKFHLQEVVTSAREALKAKQQAFEALKEEVKTSKVNPIILQSLLQLESQELQAQGQNLAKLTADHGKLDSSIISSSRTLVESIGMLEEILTELKTHDPNLATLDTDAIIAVFRQLTELFLQGSREQLAALRLPSLPAAAGLKARESADELYRSRFEALPLQFEPRRQGTQ